MTSLTYDSFGVVSGGGLYMYKNTCMVCVYVCVCCVLCVCVTTHITQTQWVIPLQCRHHIFHPTPPVSISVWPLPPTHTFMHTYTHT